MNLSVLDADNDGTVGGLVSQTGEFKGVGSALEMVSDIGIPVHVGLAKGLERGGEVG